MRLYLALFALLASSCSCSPSSSPRQEGGSEVLPDRVSIAHLEVSDYDTGEIEFSGDTIVVSYESTDGKSGHYSGVAGTLDRGLLLVDFELEQPDGGKSHIFGSASSLSATFLVHYVRSDIKDSKRLFNYDELREFDISTSNVAAVELPRFLWSHEF